MAQSLRQDFLADAAVTISLNDLADGSSVDATKIDLGNPGPFALTVECLFDGLSGGVDLVEIYAKWSTDDTDFSDDENSLLVGVVDMNQTTAVKKVFIMPVHAQHLIFRVLNNSSAAMAASGNTMRISEVAVDQA